MTKNEQSNTESIQNEKSSGKGRPTPSRKEAQKKNLRPLVPADRKASAKQARARIRERENKQYEAMKNGDIANMPASEKVPSRVYIRDYVDARFNISEFFMPLALILLLVMIFSGQNIRIALGATIFLYLYLIVIIIDSAFMWRKLKKKLIAKFGAQSVGKGTRSWLYAISRSWQMRSLRMPKPRHRSYGNWPE
ncbi:MAG: DUF3043 domain-containing protein [Bifidobacteriaceae bacterium]|nr:DUF3043 domain-containing protein [Bifidobacteriaceae bacterium]